MSQRTPLLDSNISVRPQILASVSTEITGLSATGPFRSSAAEAEADAEQVRSALHIQRRLTDMLAALRVVERAGAVSSAADAVGIVLRSLLGTKTTDALTVEDDRCRAE